MKRFATKVERPAGAGPSVALPGPWVEAWEAGTELDVLALSEDAALLLRTRGEAKAFLAGTLSAFGVDEAFGYVVAGVRTGRLVVRTRGAKKTVSFRDGQVVFATSSQPWERLGNALLRQGVLSFGQLTTALDEVRPGAKLGQVLTRKGLLTPAQLYAGMTFLVQEIALDLFCAREGTFLFQEGVAPPEDELKLPLSTQKLALEGLSRSDAVRRWARRFGPTMRVAQAKGAPDGPARLLWERAGKGTAIGALAESFEGSEHDLFAHLHQLVEEGRLSLRARTEEVPAAAPQADAPGALERYQRMVEAVCQALLGAGASLDDLRGFLADPLPGMEQAFAGVTLSDQGRMEVARVLQNVGGAKGGAQARLRAQEALDAFVSYAVFSAKNVLPPEVASDLAKKARALRGEEA